MILSILIFLLIHLLRVLLLTSTALLLLDAHTADGAANTRPPRTLLNALKDSSTLPNESSLKSSIWIHHRVA